MIKLTPFDEQKYIKNIKSGGDGNRSRFVLVPLAELFLKKNIG